MMTVIQHPDDDERYVIDPENGKVYCDCGGLTEVLDSEIWVDAYNWGVKFADFMKGRALVRKCRRRLGLPFD